MALIRKSASVTENDYKRVTLLYLKELGLLKHWYDYTSTDTYQKCALQYVKKNKGRTTAWYDRNGCMKILGMCNFGDYLKGIGVIRKCDTYHMYAAFLAIFWEEEYYKWAEDLDYKESAEEYVIKTRGFGEYYTTMIIKWIKLKNALK